MSPDSVSESRQTIAFGDERRNVAFSEEIRRVFHPRAILEGERDRFGVKNFRAPSRVHTAEIDEPNEIRQ